MIKIISIVLSIAILSISCSNSCEGEKKLKLQQKEKETQAEKKEEETQKTETTELKEYAVYPWELLEKDKQFKELYLKAIGELKNIYWIRKISATAPINQIVEIDNKKYVFITFCKPHDCYDNFVVLLYNPEERELFGYYFLGNRKVPIGKMNKQREKLILTALSEFGTREDISRLKRAKVISPNEVVDKKLTACSDIEEKVELKSLSSLGLDKNFFKMLLNATIKHEGLEEEDLEEIEITEDDVSVAFVDINDDGKKDIIYSISSLLFCGNAGCPAYLMVNLGNGKYKVIDLGILKDGSIYITSKKVKGFKTLIKNGHEILVFNGKAYRIGGECYVDQ